MNAANSQHKAHRDKLLVILQKTARDLGNKKPKAAANFILKVLLSSSRQHYLFTDERTVLVVKKKEFEQEQISMAFAYLKYGGLSEKRGVKVR